MGVLFNHLGFALQLNNVDAATRSAALAQMQAGAAALGKELRETAGPAGDLCSQLLETTPHMRPTAEQATKHTWLAHLAPRQDDKKPKKKVGIDVVEVDREEEPMAMKTSIAKE